MTYFIGIVFLFFSSVIIAIPLHLLIKNRFAAIAVSTILSSAALKIWSYIDIGEFDTGYLMMVLGIAFAASVFVNYISESFRKRLHVAKNF